MVSFKKLLGSTWDAGKSRDQPRPPSAYEGSFSPTPYSDPSVGVLSKLPKTWIPYAQLARIDRPAGFYAFYIPYLIGTMYAALIATPTPPPGMVIKLMILLLPYNIVLRGVACAWNDNVDQDFDRQVTRCCNRPIARGAVTTFQAHVFTVGLALLGLPLLGFLPRQCSIHSGITVLLFCLYALAKRVTYYPQVVLGLPFAWAIFFCLSAFEIDLFESQRIYQSTLALVASSMVWTVVYDTIYAHQDVRDDERAGVKSMAVRFRHSTKVLASWLVVFQVALLAFSGHKAEFSLVYFIGTVAGVAIAMACFVHKVDLRNPTSCGSWFYLQFWTVGTAYLIGLVGEYVLVIGKS